MVHGAAEGFGMSSHGDTLVSAEAWDDLVSDLKELGPMPDEREVLNLLLGKLWTTEGITLDEDNR